MKTTLKLAMAVAVAAAVGSALAAGPGWRAGAGGPLAGYGPGSDEHCMTMGGAGYGRGPAMSGMGRGGMTNPAVTDARLETVKSALKITAEQEAAWTGYAAAVKAQAEQRTKFREQMALTDPAARPELRNQHWPANVESAKAIDAAREGLYAVLTPEQQATADRLIGAPGFAGRGMGWAPRS